MTRLPWPFANVFGTRPATRRARPDRLVETPYAPWRPHVEVAGAPGGETASLHALIDEIEHSALDIYAAHGLPTRPGEYARRPRARKWNFIGEGLTAEERWRLALENGSTTGWKFRALEDLGGETRDPAGELAKASEMLTVCRILRTRVGATGPSGLAGELERAIRLGANWHYTSLLRDRRRAGGLRFEIVSLGEPPST